MSYKTDDWTNATGELSDMPADVRQNVSLNDHDRSTHPYVLTVTLVFSIVDEDGMPGDSTELEAADSAEESLADRFEAEHDALFGLVITTDGARDLLLFLPIELSEADIESVIDDEGIPLDYDFTLEHDPEWQTYAFVSDVTGE